ncbi:probable C-mannosyltransferase DPY19L3 isoform X2 [Poeciliopsis prolifica]|uniref:probable C-mannosyltransferase DPY19L3 isoform X2 n=1 Tax=Poeciliopsis prolifica TaxID=188132 RepID=UPI0024143CA0|nr:probable C-mannosyltransferase DPY19L3 isoform X2 [Poeciliopsis prolifica]
MFREHTDDLHFSHAMDVRKRAKVNQAGSCLGILPPGSSGERCNSGKRTEPARIREGVSPLGRSGSLSGLYLPRRWPWQRRVSMAAGLFLAVLLAVAQAWCVNAIHENLLWFSQLTEVEREISFRTECGLYYSYYKQMLQAPSIQEGLSELIHDNLTESKRTINLLQRMNIYQEVFLSVLYRLLPLQAYLEPVYFYIYTVFSLQAVYVIALYLTAWLLAGSWLAGVLTGVWYILNRVDTTRVEFTISLRENWSLPFFALQVTAVTCYLRPQLSALQQKVMAWLIYVTTCCFCLTWQFNQFILLVQALIVYILDIVDLLTTTQVTTLYLIQVSSLLSIWLLQFCNSMILGSLVLSFIVAALFIRHCQPDLKTGGLLVRLAKVLLHSILVLLLTFIINSLTKKALQLRSDEHIFKFIKSKFALGPTRDFDASLYLCEEAFGLLPLDTLERLAGTLLLYPYVPTVLLLSGMLAVAVLHNLRLGEEKRAAAREQVEAFRPDVAYNLLHSVLYGLLAFSTMRMKYIWTGHMCAVAAYGVCGTDLWTLLLKALRCNSKVLLRFIRYAVPVLMIGWLYYKFWPKLMEELSELREFYDPDTVELMTWISTKTPKQAVFAGSMQLLAGIKLCTGRVLTNHPHYEDKDLRERTRQVYQVYARRSPEEVYDILRAVGADYVVLENSICYERRHQRGCRLRDLLDLANGHIMDGPGENEPDLVPASHPRFCEAIKTDDAAYSALFTRTFQNKTFYVYRLKKKRKKSSKASSEPGVKQ